VHISLDETSGTVFGSNQGFGFIAWILEQFLEHELPRLSSRSRHEHFSGIASAESDTRWRKQCHDAHEKQSTP
jgi:hypothetical protein